jgi:lipoate-protein ligase A
MTYQVTVNLRFTDLEDEKELISLKKSIESLVRKFKKTSIPVDIQYKIYEEIAESIQ